MKKEWIQFQRVFLKNTVCYNSYSNQYSTLLPLHHGFIFLLPFDLRTASVSIEQDMLLKRYVVKYLNSIYFMSSFAKNLSPLNIDGSNKFVSSFGHWNFSVHQMGYILRSSTLLIKLVPVNCLMISVHVLFGVPLFNFFVSFRFLFDY